MVLSGSGPTITPPVQKQIDQLYELFKKQALVLSLPDTLKEKVPGILERLQEKDRKTALEMATWIAEKNQIDAMNFLDKTPTVFNDIDARAKKYLKAVMKKTTSNSKYNLSLFEDAPAILHEIPKKYHREVLRETFTISTIDANVAYWFFKHASEILKTPQHYAEYKQTSEIIAGTGKTSGFFTHSAEFIHAFPEYYHQYAQLAQSAQNKDIAHWVLRDAKDVLEKTDAEHRTFVLEALKTLSEKVWYRIYEFFSQLPKVMGEVPPKYTVPLLSYFVKARDVINRSTDRSSKADVDIFTQAPAVTEKLLQEHGSQYVDYVFDLIDEVVEADPKAARDVFINAPAVLNQVPPDYKKEGLRQYSRIAQRLLENPRTRFTKILLDAKPPHTRPVLDAAEIVCDRDKDFGSRMVRELPGILEGVPDGLELEPSYILVRLITDPQSANVILPHIDRDKYRAELSRRVKTFY